MTDTLDLNGVITDAGTTAIEIADAMPGAHVGTATADFTLIYNATTVELRAGQDITADPALYVAINAAGAPVSWST
jgi:hypothetical protein